MTIGRKSITTVITVPNNENPKKPHEITVQANKNHAICDMAPRVNEVLSDFQGRQLVSKDLQSGNLYLNDEVIKELEAALDRELNPKKDWHEKERIRG